MDEHDKRAREVMKTLMGWSDDDLHLAPEAIAELATALREAEARGQNAALAPLLNARVAAAVAAERERCKAMALEYRDGVKPFGSYPEASADADGRRDAADAIADRIAAAPAAPLASPAQAERVSEDDEYAVRFETVTDAHARGCRETQHRIAARLRARADADEKTVADIRRDWLAHKDRTGDAGRMERLEAIIGVLRSEADALEGT